MNGFHLRKAFISLSVWIDRFISKGTDIWKRALKSIRKALKKY
jgi:hypothetical protein